MNHGDFTGASRCEWVGDPGAGSETGGGGGSFGGTAGTAVIGGFLGGVAGSAAFGKGGLGGAALRGVLQGQQLQQRIANLQAARFYALADAEARRVANFAPGARTTLQTTVQITPQTRALAKAITDLQTAASNARRAGHALQAQRLEAQARNHQIALARAQAQQVPQYRYVAQYGPNNGPPLPGGE